jgi:hypothetical protein
MLAIRVVLIFILLAVVPSTDSRYHLTVPLDAQTPSKNEARLETWLQKNYSVVLNEVMPLPSQSRVGDDIKWVVTVRVQPSYEAEELQFTIRQSYTGKVEVEIIRPEGKSIRSQLRELKKKYPSASLSMLAGKISIERRAVSGTTTKEIEGLAARFENIPMSPVLPDELFVDYTEYEFWSISQWGNLLRIRLRGPGSKAKAQPHALLDWAERMRRFIDNS